MIISALNLYLPTPLGFPKMFSFKLHVLRQCGMKLEEQFVLPIYMYMWVSTGTFPTYPWQPANEPMNYQ